MQSLRRSLELQHDRGWTHRGKCIQPLASQRGAPLQSPQFHPSQHNRQSYAASYGEQEPGFV